MSQGTVLATGVRDESDVLPALETSQFSGRNRLMCVIHRMCYDQSLQCLGTADGSLKSVWGFRIGFSEMKFKWNLNGHTNSPGEIKYVCEGGDISDRGSWTKAEGCEWAPQVWVMERMEHVLHIRVERPETRKVVGGPRSRPLWCHGSHWRVVGRRSWSGKVLIGGSVRPVWEWREDKLT